MSTHEQTSCYNFREETAMTEFEVITTILTGITTLTAIIAVYLQAQSQKKERR